MYILEMSCCKKDDIPATKETTKSDFLKEKAKNFRDYIMKYQPTEEVKTYLQGFDESKLEYTILTVLIPMKMVASEEIYIDDLMGRLTIPESEVEAVKTKITRYFKMFCDVIVSMA
jgi:hypothetical protein